MSLHRPLISFSSRAAQGPGSGNEGPSQNPIQDGRPRVQEPADGRVNCSGSGAPEPFPVRQNSAVRQGSNPELPWWCFCPHFAGRTNRGGRRSCRREGGAHFRVPSERIPLLGNLREQLAPHVHDNFSIRRDGKVPLRELTSRNPPSLLGPRDQLLSPIPSSYFLFLW